MKKILLILIVLLTCLGCSTGHNKPDTENEDKITEENSIWVINPYNPISYNEYYSTERTVEFYGNNNLQAKTEGLYCNYSADTNGIFVYTLQDENQFDGTYTERQFILKPANLQTYLTSYSKILQSDGYWFYFEIIDNNSSPATRQLSRINYLGEKQIIIENFDSEVYHNVYLKDRDVLIAVKNGEEFVQLELYYLNGLQKEVIDTVIPNSNGKYVKIKYVNSSYHIVYEGLSPEYIAAYNKLMADNQAELNNLLKKYKLELIEGNDDYTAQVLNYLIYVEYNTYRNADYDYNIIDKTTQYQPLITDIIVPNPIDPDK